MEVPETRYALREGHHIGYQVWGEGPPDVLEFNNGLMISIDETSDEPSWLRYEESLASFSRLIRFDALGLGLSDPDRSTAEHRSLGRRCARRPGRCRRGAGGRRSPPAGARCRRSGWRHTIPNACARLVLINGTARVIRADDYPIGIPDDILAAIPSRH